MSTKTTEWSAENLERAAKHMRELDKSVNAKAAIELARREQDVDLAREVTRQKEHETQRAQASAQGERVRWEEQRKTIDHKRESEKVREVLDTLLCRRRNALVDTCARTRAALHVLAKKTTAHLFYSAALG